MRRRAVSVLRKLDRYKDVPLSVNLKLRGVGACQKLCVANANVISKNNFNCLFTKVSSDR